MAGGASGPATTTSYNLPLGGGGNEWGVSVAQDGTGKMLARTDSSGTFLSNTAPGYALVNIVTGTASAGTVTLGGWAAVTAAPMIGSTIVVAGSGVGAWNGSQTVTAATLTSVSFASGTGGSSGAGTVAMTGALWTNVNNPTAMPSAFLTGGPSPQLVSGSVAVYVRPGNSSIMYQMYCPVSSSSTPSFNLAFLLKSTNGGVTWATTGLTPGYMGNNQDTALGMTNQIVDDPNNANIVWVNVVTNSGGTAQLQVSVNGGTSFAAVSGLPTGTCICGLAYDPTSGTTGGSTNRMLAAVRGGSSPGVYVSANAYNGSTSTWTLVTSSVATIRTGKISASSTSDGTYYCCSDASNFYRISTGNTWAAIGTSGYCFAIDPNNPARVIQCGNGGSFTIPTSAVNTGTPTWGTTQNNTSITVYDSPWLAYQQSTSPGGYLTANDIEWDSWTTTSASSMSIANSGTVTFTDGSAGGNAAYMAIGRTIRIQRTGIPATYMLATIATYNNSTGVTTATLGVTNGGYLGGPSSGASGPFTAWTICMERIFIAAGFGMYYQDGFVVGQSPGQYVAFSAGIETFDGLDVCWPWTSSQGAGSPICVVNDACGVAITSQPVGTTIGASLNPIPAVNSTPVANEGTRVDHAKNDRTFLVLANEANVYTSSSGGATTASWSIMGTQPPNVAGGNGCAVYTSTNFVIATSNSNGLYQWNGSSWTQVSSTSGLNWGGAFSAGHALTVDWVDGTYIGTNGGNVYKWQTPSSVTKYTIGFNTGGAAQILSVPGQQGHVFFAVNVPSITYTSLSAYILSTSVPNVGGSGVTQTTIFFSSNYGQTWTALPNVSTPGAMAFTAPKAGQTYPSIRFWGFVQVVVGTAVFNTSTPTIALTNTFVAGQAVVLSGTTAPTGFTFGTTYYVIATGLSGSQCELSATQGGSAIQASSTGSAVTASLWTWGLWRVDGFNSGSISTTTYVQEGPTYPRGCFTQVYGMGGDMGQWGRTITALGGGGFSIEQISGQTNAWP